MWGGAKEETCAGAKMRDVVVLDDLRVLRGSAMMPPLLAEETKVLFVFSSSLTFAS